METIEKIELERKKLIEKILAFEEILSGSFNSIYRKCGKVNCWCNKAAQGHFIKRYSWKDNESDTSKTKAVHKEDEDWITLCLANYKELKKALTDLNLLDDDLHLAIKELIKKRLEITRKYKGW
jgi:hypothetical protein